MNHLSSSQIYLYLQCSLKYRFKYIDRLPATFKPSALAFGSAIHSAISWFHLNRMNGKEVTLERFLKIFDADWYTQRLDTDIHYKDNEGERGLALLAKEMLSLYFQEPIREAKRSEAPFTIPLADPTTSKDLGINLEGFFDLIEKDETIVEFKTSNQTMCQEDVDEHLQLTAYSYAYERLHGKPPKLKIVNFVKNKKPKMLVFETKRCKAEHQRFFSLASKVFDGIRHQVFFPRQSFMCNDCEYERACGEWGKG